MKNKDLDKLFREKAKNFKPKVSDEIWTRIETQLSGRQTNRSRRNLFNWVSVAAALLIVFTGVWFTLVNSSSDNHLLKDPISNKIDENPIRKPESNDFENPIREKEASDIPRTSEKRYASSTSTSRMPVIQRNRRPDSARISSLLNDIGVTATVPEIVALPLKNLPATMDASTFGSPIAANQSMEASYRAAYQESKSDMIDAGIQANSLGVSAILNTVVNALQKDDDVKIVFSEDREGILKIDVSRLLTKR